MSFDPHDPAQFSRVRNSVRMSRSEMSDIALNREMILRQLRGPRHKSWKPDVKQRRPRHKLEAALENMTQSIVDGDPTVRVEESENGSPRLADLFRARLQHEVIRTRMYEAIQDSCYEGFLTGIAVAHAGLAPSLPYGVEGNEYHDPGEFAVDLIDFPDLILDMRVRHWRNMEYIGHAYSIRRDVLMSDPSFDREAVRKAPTAISRIRKPDGNFGNDWATVYEYVNLVNLWFPDGRIIVTALDGPPGPYAVDIGDVIRVVQFNGPQCGPYHPLVYKPRMDSVIGASFADLNYDNAEFVSGVYRKMYGQAVRQAELYLYEGSKEAQADRIRKGEDGVFLNVDDPNGVVRFVKGGVNPLTMNLGLLADRIFDQDSGAAALNASPSSGITLGELRMRAANTSREIKAYKDKTYKFADSILGAAAWYIWHDPVTEMAVERTLSSGVKVPDKWSPDVVNGSIYDYDIGIVSGSMSRRTNEEQLAGLVESLQIFMQTAQLPSASGPLTFDHQYFWDEMAELRNEPELKRMLKFAPDSASVTPGVQLSGATGMQGQDVSSQAPPVKQGMDLTDRLISSGTGGRQEES